MLLSRLSDTLRQHRRASLVDLAHRLEADPEALREMLAVLERKGRVRRLPGGGACGGCCKCDAAGVEVYEWTGD